MTQKATCLIKGCTSVLSISKNSPKSCLTHLKSLKHNLVDDDIYTSQKNEDSNKILNFAKRIFVTDTIHTKILRLVSLSNLPIFKIVCDDDIRDLLEFKYKTKLNKSFSSIRASILESSNFIKYELKNLILTEIAKNTIPTFLFDEWTSRNNKRFISVIVRFGSKEYTIGLIYIDGSANSENLKNIILKKLEEFNIVPSKIFCFTADGAAVNKKISNEMGIKIQQCQNHGIHLGKMRFLHEYNLIQAVLETLYKKHSEAQYRCDENDENEENSSMIEHVKISDPMLSDDKIKIALATLRSTIKRFSNSPKLTNFLSKETELRPQVDVKTRWNSMLHMIRSYLRIREHIKTALIKADIDILVTKDQEKLLEFVADLLEPVEYAINRLSDKESNLITADLIFTEMISEIDSKPDSSLKSNLKKNLIARIKARRTIYSDIAFFLFKKNFKDSQNCFYDKSLTIEEISCALPQISENKIVEKAHGSFKLKYT